MKKLFCLAAVAAVLTAGGAAAEVPPVGTVVDRSNLAQYRDALGPGLEWIVDRGV